MTDYEAEGRARRDAEAILKTLAELGVRPKAIASIVGTQPVAIKRAARGEAQVALWIVSEIIRRFGAR